MAGVGAGAWRDLDAACAAGITVAERIEPDPAWVEAYAAGYARWRKLYPALATLG
jgi:xylulokinase